MEQEKRPNVTEREWVGKYNEATGQFDLKYLDWAYAGGPNECKHGYAEGIPCPDCDKAEHPDHAVIRKHWESMGEQ